MHAEQHVDFVRACSWSYSRRYIIGTSLSRLCKKKESPSLGLMLSVTEHCLRIIQNLYWCEVASNSMILYTFYVVLYSLLRVAVFVDFVPCKPNYEHRTEFSCLFTSAHKHIYCVCDKMKNNFHISTRQRRQHEQMPCRCFDIWWNPKNGYKFLWVFRGSTMITVTNLSQVSERTRQKWIYVFLFHSSVLFVFIVIMIWCVCVCVDTHCWLFTWWTLNIFTT